MAPFALRPRQSERRSAQLHERRAPQVGGLMFSEPSHFSRTSAVVRDVEHANLARDAAPSHSSSSLPQSSQSTPSSTASPLVDSPKLPGTAAALAGVCTFLGVGVLSK